MTTGFVMLLAAMAAPAAAESSEPSMTIRVYDYEHLSPRGFARAQRRVSEIYNTIGIRTEWRGVMRPSPTQAFDPTTIPGAEDLLVIVLNSQMSRHKPFGDNVLGSAVVTPDDGGRIAYVLYDQLREMANSAGADTMDVMGVVIAHELGHLLLPGESHSEIGVMRPTWTPRQLRTAFQGQTAFTPAQRDIIRGRVLRASGPVPESAPTKTGD